MDKTSKVSVAKRLWNLLAKRVTESKYTIAYCTLLTLSTITCIILEAIIVNADLEIYSDLQRVDPNITTYPSTSIHLASTDTDNVALGLRRLKNENVFFILVSLFQLALGLDAVLRQSVIQLIAHTTNQFLSTIFASIQVLETSEKNQIVNQNILDAIANATGILTRIRLYFLIALRNGIGLVVVMALFSFIFVYLSYQLFKQFGWNTYKRIGADIQQQERFRLAQIFFMFLKLDAFFQLVLCIFYTVVMSQEQYFALWSIDRKKFVGYIIHIVLTALLIPALLVARYGVIAENRTVMVAFQVTQIIVIIDFVLVLVDSAGTWVFWILAVCVAIVLCVVTIVISFLVAKNFDKGLKPYMQRLFDSNEENDKQDKGNLLRNEEWLIDDEDDYTPSHK
ncbi:hypothetical protein G6F70_001637 [Rhizopus microsporus]|uniref:TRP C-terminal domain-containing protein n=2 Tax=Rhizopus TaxID=4842 RepID=A0A1X0SBK7_RHIZD|nr:hypothetical protein G6F71_000445 [Rhizopus microsporus]KAG1203149.1 hypothetical protein G6F70_001637 [Rhizopus microsporus]KAG1215602.1 hypothetical protein G6F69_000866 [Rhizopus microsporus]KAG1238124.1 hypothetical protein G6F67_000680 [Rhizopus microsporus]KAG1268776.1 hypothetical protein G6F68_000832 [Rhizopus microsporus]